MTPQLPRPLAAAALSLLVLSACGRRAEPTPDAGLGDLPDAAEEAADAAEAPDAGADAATPLPAPTLRTPDPFVPSTATAEGPGFTLHVFGTSFVPETKVRWDGAEVPTTLVSPTELTATIAAAAVASAKTVQVSVVTPPPGGGTASGSFAVENPAPQLAVTGALSPTFAEAGGAALALTVRGMGFVKTSSVQWNGAARVTTFVSATELTAAISAADVATAGVAQVAVVNPAPGGGTSGSAPFVIRTRPGAVLRASLSNTGAEGNDTSMSPVVSATGRYVIFASDATNLVTGDTWGVQDVFVRDTCLGEASCAPSTVRVSVPNAGGEAFSHCVDPVVTPNGRYVAFTSAAYNLVAGDNNAVPDVFVRDTCIGVPGCTPSTFRVSVDSNGVEGNDASDLPAISADGRFVAFHSTATNLVPGDTTGRADVFVRDTCLGATGACAPSTVRVSVSTQGVAGDFESGMERPAISANGRYVAFSSMASNLGATADANARSDIYVRDTCFTTSPGSCSPSTVRVSVGDQGQEGTGASSAPGISDDGRVVVFASNANNLVANDTNLGDVFVRDTCLGAAAGCAPSTVRVSVTTTGQEANGINFDPVISGDGRFVGFSTWASNLQSGTTIAGVVRDTCRGASGCTPATNQVTLAMPGGTNPSMIAGRMVLTPDGKYAVWASDGAGVVPNDTNGKRDVFVSATGF